MPHGRLPTIIIDHPLEGDNPIGFRVDGRSLDTVVPRHIPKSSAKFLEALGSKW